MYRDGKQLESLVAFVEKVLLPHGFSVTANDRVFDDDGTQIAEFDVLARGRVGSTEFQWLIECRDRPSSGPAPSSWVEQLVGRRTRFKFDKVTAVSTTGFASGAVEFAQAQGIELREVKSLAPDEFADWLQMQYLTNHLRLTTLRELNVVLHEDTTSDLQTSLESVVQTIVGASPVLRSSTSGELVSPASAFASAANANQTLFEGLVPNGDAKAVRLAVQYSNEDYFKVETPKGSVRILALEFVGDVRLKEEKLPVVYAGEYRSLETGAPISQVVSFAPQSVKGMKFTIELHKFVESGGTRVTLRRLPPDA